MNSGTLPRTGRLARLLAALLMLFLTLGPASPGRAARTQAATEAPLDLAAMTLTPADLADTGSVGYRFNPGQAVGHVGEGSLAYWIGEWTEKMANDDIQASLEDAGLGRGYEFGLILRQDLDDPRSDLAHSIRGSLYEFAAEDGAAEGFELLDELSAEYEGVERVEGDEVIGDRTALIRPVPKGDTETPELVIAFRAGRLLVLLHVWDYRSQEPQVAEVEALGARLLERIEAGFAGDLPGLGSRVPRLTSDKYGDLYEVRLDQYLRLDGEDFRFDLEEPDAFAARVETAGDAIDVYALNQFVQDAETDPPVPYQFNWFVRLYRFAGEEEAGAWLAAQPDLIAAGEGRAVEISEMEPLADAPTFGDESAAFTYVQDSGDGYPSRVVRVQARVGVTVADVQLVMFAEEEPPVAALEALAADQMICLAGDGCPNQVTISDALAGRMPTGGTIPGGKEGVLDFAAMTLTPADLTSEGLDGYGIGYGQTAFPDDVIASTAQARGLPESDVRQTLEGAGFVRRYDSYLYLPADENDPAGTAAQAVVSYVLEFADETGAADAWGFLEDESFSNTAQDVPGAKAIGDASEATRDHGTDAASGAAYQQLDVSFRLGRLQAGATIVDWQGQEPDLAEAEALAERLRQRIETVLADGAPGLGSQIPRLGGPGVAPSADYYLVRDGAALPLYGESIGDTRARQDAAANAGETSGYRLWQQVAAGNGGADDDVWYMVELDRFADEEAAADWLAHAVGRVRANAAMTDLKVERKAPTFGDASLTYTVQTTDGAWRYRSIALRSGATVAIVDVGAPETPPAEAMEPLAEAQAACLASGGCAEALALPEELQSFIAGLGEPGGPGEGEATPATRITPEPVVTPTVDTRGTKAETYTSPTYGYSLTYDPDIWTVVDDYVGSYDSLTLQSQAATLILSGTNVYDDLAGCLAGAIGGAQLGEGTPAEGIAGPTPAAGAEAALMAYDVTTTEGTVATLAAYFECRWVVEGESTLSITLMAGADAFPAVLPLYEDLIAGLTVTAADMGEQAAGGQTYVSPSWGYSVTWDPDEWVPMDKKLDDGIVLHVMGSSLVLVRIEGVEDFEGDPEACLTGVVEAAQGDTPLTASDDFLAPATAEDAVGGVYEFGDFGVFYLECRPLVPEQAVLQIRVGAPAGEYDAALPAIERLLAGIRVA